MKKKYDVVGMSCAACQAAVNKHVSKVAGVNEVNVNLLTNSMELELDESKASDEDVIQAVKEAGYEAFIPGEKTKTNNPVNETDSLKKRFIISLIFLLILMYFSMGHMVGLPMPSFLIGVRNAPLNAFIQLLLLIPIIYINRNYYIKGFKSLYNLSPNMDALVAIGSASAMIYGIVSIMLMIYSLSINDNSTLTYYSKNLYFESAGMILTLITLGKYFESKSKGKTTSAINSLVKLSPSLVTIKADNKKKVIDASDVKVGDIVIIKSGSTVPIDGTIIKGTSYLNESAITGESVPVEKKVGDTVTSGTTNTNGYLEIEANNVGKDTTINQIIRLVEEASSSKAPIAKVADKVAGVFVPVVIGLSIITFIIWMVIGKELSFSLDMAISVLVISCPCALGLATPVAIMVGTGQGAKNGILIRSSEVLETLESIDVAVLDKTGTITTGKPVVCDYQTKIDLNSFLEIITGIESGSEHPLGKAIMESDLVKNITPLTFTKYETVFGRGIKAYYENDVYYAGNLQMMLEAGINNIYEKELDSLSKEGKTTLLFAKNKEMIGFVSLLDKPKDTSFKAIELIKELGIKVVMLTGDNKVVAKAFKKDLNLDEAYGEVLPKQKASKIEELQNSGHKVLMVGDGVNDSIALATANVGITIKKGSDVAIENSDIILMKNDLLDVYNAIRLSKQTMRNIKENLFWAFFYNAICIPLAAGALYIPFGIKLSPMIGAAAMSLSSVCVVSNALRLKRFKVVKKENDYMKTVLNIEGMMCENCVRHVNKALSELDGVISVEVSLKDNNAVVTTDKDIPLDVYSNALNEAGYKLK
ncbi:MAG: heavy metal translocating P-type ATPase [Thomasclavelia sp.]|nr:heavy metal translocating P-type ATPase [Thomasclavelia sp.]